MRLKKLITLVTLIVGLGTMSVASAFSDMPNDHWAYSKVNEMVNKGIISGYTDGTFKPERAVTREEFATILTKTLGLKNDGEIIEFRDIESDKWSKPYIDAASRYLTGYLNNGNYYFYPTSPAVREDMAVAVVKAKGLENQTPDYSVLDKFSDKNKISENLKKYIAIAVKNGIMAGNTDGTFNPTGNLTRAEITALMSNVLEKVVINEEIKEQEKEEHKHETIKKYKYENEEYHIERDVCKSCGEVVNENVVKHNFNNGECICGIEEDIKEIAVKIGGKWYASEDEIQITSWLFMSVDEEYKLETKVNGELTTEGLEFSVEANPFGVKISEKGIIEAVDVGTAKGIIKSENGIIIKFNIWINEKEVEVIYGDVNGDGRVTKEDSDLIFQYSLYPDVYGKDVIAEVEKYGDVNEDGELDIEDSMIIKAYADKKIDKLPHEHSYINGKCKCGVEDDSVLYGDVNSDGYVTNKDRLVLERYLDNWSGYEEQVNKKNADVFIDGEVDKMDHIVISWYIAKIRNIDIPHECGSYTVKYEEVNGEVHNIIYECKCGIIEDEEEVSHDFVNGKCVCGAEETK